MDLQITWETIGKVFLVGVFTYVFAPAFLILRDFILWKVVKRFILTNKLQRLIQMRANDVWLLKNKYNYSRSIEDYSDGTNYFLNGEKVPENQFNKVSDAISFHEKRSDMAGAEIVWRSNLINWIFRHYKQEGSSNPIPKWEKNAYGRVERREANNG